MDGAVATSKGSKTVAYLTPDQAALYGGYVEAASKLKVQLILPPMLLVEDSSLLEGTVEFPEVGHG